MNNNRKKKMLITGVSGLLGNNLAFCLKESYDILGVYCTHKVEIEGIQTRKADLLSNTDMSELIEEFDPDIIIHGAAMADVETCEIDPQKAQEVNVGGTRNLVESLSGCDAKLIHISSDLVYDGIKGDFAEDDSVSPVNHYGVTKCKAEEEALKRKGSLVLRTNFFGWNIFDKYSLGEWVIHELAQENEIKGFSDCIFSTIYTFELAKILDAIIKKNLSGVYNCTSATALSKYEFLVKIAEKLNLNKDLIEPVLVDDVGLKAKRGKCLSLSTKKLAKDLGKNIPPVDHSIDCFVNDFKDGLPEIIKKNRFSRNIYPNGLDVIPYGRQGIDDDDINAVVDVLKSASITQGSKIREFEAALCRVTDASLGCVVNSGTSALHIACLAAGIGPGDEVITSPNTFVASANCVVYCGGAPVFADIDFKTYNIDPKEIEKKINERTKAVIPVHFAGQSCDMKRIKDIVSAGEKKYGHKITIIEDACHALGSYYREEKVGSCAYSDMAVMSFHPVKHITTGEGGCVLTNDKKLRRKLSYFRSHGITSDPDEFLYKENAFEKDLGDGHAPIRNQWYYEQNCLGYNYRMTEIQCVLGISQLKKLDGFCQRRHEIVKKYNLDFKDLKHLTIPSEDNSCYSNFHLYALQFDFDKIGITRAQLMAELREEGILTQVHYIPVHTQPFYQKNFGTHLGDYPNAEHYYRNCLSIPLYPAMEKAEVDKVIKNIKKIAG